MPRIKAYNANYAEYMERLLDAYIKGSVSFTIIDAQMIADPSVITNDEKQQMLIWAQNIQNKYHFKESQYIGRQTSTANGDLILDNKITELKCVSKGTGTYFNTSVAYFNKFNIKNPITAYEQIGYRDVLQKLIQPFGFKTTSKGELSFVTMDDSKQIQKLSIYNKIQYLDQKLREIYCQKLYHYLLAHPQQLQEFITDMMYKGEKGPAQQMLVYNYYNDSMNLINLQSLIDKNIQQIVLRKSGKYGFSWGDSCRAQIGWQNGSGLNNFTIRVFI